MDGMTEFRPVAHEFYPEDDYHGAAFVGAKAADALWFYRYDASFIEVRDVFSCQDKVFASLSTADIKQRFSNILSGDQLRIVNVQDAYVGEFHTLVFVIREVQEDRDHAFIWNLSTLHLQRLVSPPRLLTAATVTAQQAITVSHRLVKSWGKDRDGPLSPTNPSLIFNGSRTGLSHSKQSSQGVNSIDLDHDDDEESQESAASQGQQKVRIQGNRRQLLVLGHRNGWISVYKFTVSLTGEVTCGKEPEHEKCLHNGSITSLATISNQSTKGIPVVVAGTSEGKAYVLKYDGSNDTDALPVLITLHDLKSTTLPITSLTLESTRDSSLTLLAVGQGLHSGLSESNECPAVSIYYLRLQRPDYWLLGHVQASVLEGEVIRGGRTLAAAVSEDENGLRIHCAFSIKVDNSPLRSQLTIVQINQKDVQRLDFVELSAVEGGTLLDISPQTNSYELVFLYLNKLTTYVTAADIERSRQEAEWAEGGQGAEKKQKDQTPAYNNYFPLGAKLGYTDAELDEIVQRREQLGGKLFYDRLLEFVDLKTGALYPPDSHAQQRNLWTNIYFNGDLETDNRNCLAYYLLKNQHGDLSKQFLSDHVIPSQFVDLMDGFWALDHFEFKNAVLYLSRPGLTVDWVEDVIEAICEHASPQLAHQFLVAANLDLTTPKFIVTKMKALLHTDFVEALYYQRSIGKKLDSSANLIKKDGQSMSVDTTSVTQGQLFSMLLEYCFLDKPNRSAIHELSLLTMTEQEERFFQKFCDEHSVQSSSIAQDFLILYYVNHSRFMEAIRLHQKLLLVELEKEDAEKFHREAIERRNSRSYNNNGNSKNGGDGAPRQPLNKSQKRQVLMNRLIAILPEAQRLVLKIEDDQRQQKAGGTGGKPTISFGQGVDERTLDSTRKVVEKLVEEVDAPLASVKTLDLDWITKALAKNLQEEDDDQDLYDVDSNAAVEEDMTASVDDKDESEVDDAHASASRSLTGGSEVEVMELDDSDDDL
ncbi:hypothetical protein BGZ94_007423 [Podila epigama]|nr:hypothetical protein BGZ94_007423 [Podila epigama]